MAHCDPQAPLSDWKAAVHAPSIVPLGWWDVQKILQILESVRGHLKCARLRVEDPTQYYLLHSPISISLTILLEANRVFDFGRWRREDILDYL